MFYTFLEEMIEGIISNFNNMYKFSIREENFNNDIDSDFSADESEIKAEEKRLLQIIAIRNFVGS